MRKVAPLVGLALLLCSTSPADAPAADRPDLVLRAGMNASTMHEDNLSARSRRGLALGLGTRLRLNHDFVLLPEVWYHQKGLRRGTLWEQIDLDTRFQTISVPVLLALRLPSTQFESRACIGVALDWMLKSEIFRYDRQQWQEITEGDEAVYVSLIVAGGTRWRNLDLDVRYQHGLSRVTEFDYREFRDIIPLLHPFDPGFDRTWTLTAGLWF